MKKSAAEMEGGGNGGEEGWDSADAAGRLLAWYDERARELPWRENQDPYRVWISEIMLQQTRVETVIPYFRRFLDRFPYVEDLARAPLEDVLTLWSGLGYYRRARQLHSAAQEIAARGSFPSTAQELQQLPGIGAYTSAAVASIAFGEAVAVVDGNVERVMARMLSLEVDPKRAAGQRSIRSAATRLVDEKRPGDSNQALMELGATVCLPRRPKCTDCPVTGECSARVSGRQEEFPVKKARRAPILVYRKAVLVSDEERILLVRRSDASELLAGMWELPWVEAKGEEKAEGAQRELEAQLVANYGGRWTVGNQVAEVRHAITHRAIRVAVFEAKLEAGAEVRESVPCRWVLPADIKELPTPAVVGKILRACDLESAQGKLF
ncbi:MAG: A/G-specific adenine glycosylase [Acidobacteriota bacterium]